MSSLKDNNSYVTTATGGIDYAYYYKRARIARSNALSGSKDALKRIIRWPRLRLSLPAALPGSESVAKPCS